MAHQCTTGLVSISDEDMKENDKLWGFDQPEIDQSQQQQRYGPWVTCSPYRNLPKSQAQVHIEMEQQRLVNFGLPPPRVKHFVSVADNMKAAVVFRE